MLLFHNITNFLEVSESQQQQLNDLDDEIKKLTVVSEQKQHMKEIQSEKLKVNENAVKQKTNGK